LYIVAAELGDQRSDRRVRRPDLHALDVARHHDLLGARVERAGIVGEGEAELDVLHLLAGVFAVPAVECRGAALAVGQHERQIAGVEDREAAGLIAGIDIGHVGDAVARHVVMVKRLAELLRRIDFVFDGAAGIVLDRGAPILHRLLQRMRWRHPMRQLELEGLVLGRGRADSECEAKHREAAKRSWARPAHEALPLWRLVAVPTDSSKRKSLALYSSERGAQLNERLYRSMSVGR